LQLHFVNTHDQVPDSCARKFDEHLAQLIARLRKFSQEP